MSSSDELLSFMDLLDLDEDVIDSRLETIMVRNTYSNKHLRNALQLLQCKHMINLQENIECENHKESDFIAKLINDMNEENIDLICKITFVVLCLNTSEIISKSEHLLQQIISNIDLPSNQAQDNTIEDVKSSIIMLNLKICDSILDAVIKNGGKLSLIFLEVPLETILLCSNERLNIHFLTNTVPRLFEGVVGYNILGRIWKFVKQMNDKENALKILSCLSEFYLPVADEKGKVKYESTIVFDYEFWNILQFGLMSNDPSVRKISVYLIKRSIDCSMTLKKNICVKSKNDTLFLWEQKTGNQQKQMWDNFFILIDSLEEKQSNIVLPSLKLFDNLKDMQNCWLNCAFNIALKHDNTQVRLKCIDYRLQFIITSEEEAVILLEALNDINVYDCFQETELLKEKLAVRLKDIESFRYILKAISKIKWSPVPFFHLSNVLASIKGKSFMEITDLPQIVIDILKVPINNIAIRKAVHVNMSHFIGNCCKELHLKEIIDICSLLKFETCSLDDKDYNPFRSMINGLNFNEDEKKNLFNVSTDTHANIDFVIFYLKSHPGDMPIFIEKLAEKIKRIKDITHRQYCNKMECLNDVIYLTQLFSKTFELYNSSENATFNKTVFSEYKNLLQYILSLLSNETAISSEEIVLLFKGFPTMFCLNALIDETDVREIQLQLYKSSVLLIKDNDTKLQTKVISIFVINYLTKDLSFVKQYKHEMLSINQMLKLFGNMEFQQMQNKENNGRLRNIFFEKSCEVIYYSLKQQETEIKSNIKEIIEFVENVTECGGYGCLKWVLKTMNKIIPELLDDGNSQFNIINFVDRTWKEIEELKSNNQYSPCIEEFVNLIMHKALLKQPMYNNVIIFYCNKIIEYGPMKNAPLFYLIRKLNGKDITTHHGQLIYILSEILIYSPVPRKDQRITENIEVEILHDPKYGKYNHTDIHFNYEIKHLSISTLCKIDNPEILNSILSVITKKIDETFKNKQRYHGNSQAHRLLLTGLQHILLIVLLDLKTVCNERVLSWMIDLMGKLPHQPSVRICLEWYIALYLYVKNVKLDANIELLKSSKIPATSKFVILYWILKHKIANESYKDEEYNFVMDELLSHTMGQMFNVRLHAQYLATELYKTKNSEKYAYTIEVINKTFTESAKDKNYIKLKEEFFINKFDLVSHLTPCFIYYFMPRYFEIGANETVHRSYIAKAFQDMNKNVTKEYTKKGFDDLNDFIKEWSFIQMSDDDLFSYNFNRSPERNVALENGDTLGTIQKKYIPWRNMSDIDVYETGKKRESNGELIVVASLIDKLPNLGGIARTSEVFGVKTYVVDSLRHLQDKQFQGLSVSAERWVDIEEVRPGQPLKDYLTRVKAQGYCVVAAEQTSTSCTLQSFKFPKKTLLLLGHEKEGIPCDLLPFMDQCVEIPQQGFVRSLNVHVTASIFIWEYVRQNLL